MRHSYVRPWPSSAPFNPSTIIPYQLPSSGHVRLEVLNVLGQRLATLVDAERSAGAHTAQWDGTDAAGLWEPGCISTSSVAAE